MLGVGGLVSGGLDQGTSPGVGSINLGLGGMPRMVGVNMGGLVGAGVGNPYIGAGPLGAMGGIGATAGGMATMGRLEAGRGGGYLLVNTPGVTSSSSSSPTPAPLRFPTYSPAGLVRQNLEDTSFTRPNESMSSL